MSKNTTDPNHYLISFNEVSRLCAGASRNTIKRWQKKLGFPAHIALGPNKVAWYFDEILVWQEQGRGRAGRFPQQPAE